MFKQRQGQEGQGRPGNREEEEEAATGKKTNRRTARRRNQKNPTPTPTTTPTTPPLNPTHNTDPPTKPKTRGKLNVNYINVGRSQAVTHAAFNQIQNHDILFISEPFIHILPDENPSHPSHPSWRRVTPIQKHTKLIAFTNIRLQSAKGKINRAGTVGTVSIALTNIVGVYLNGKAPIEDLRDDLANITRHGRVVILGDINAHSTTWGAPNNNNRGEEVTN